MKKLFTILGFSFLLTQAAFAAEAPPSLDLGGLLDGVDQQDQQVDDAPPSLNLDLGQDVAINLSSLRVAPNPFNPLVQDAEISFTLSNTAAVTIEVLNALGQRVVYLANNDVIGAGDYSAQWKGTINNEANGSLVDQGTYAYRITAADPESGQIVDTEQGNIQVNYGTNANEAVPQVDQNSQNQANAVLAVQNMESGRTSETGMPIFAYLALPFSYLIPRYLKKLN